MCNGFGMIVSKDMQAYFCEPDGSGDVSHSEILERLGWKDNADQHLRAFVRVECPDWTIGSFRFDEDATLPGWAEDERDAIINIVAKAVAKARPAWSEYKKVTDAAWSEYKKVEDAAWAEYNKVQASAWARLISRLSRVRGYVKA